MGDTDLEPLSVPSVDRRRQEWRLLIPTLTILVLIIGFVFLNHIQDACHSNKTTQKN